jgi:predicted Zn-dependent peptidase
MHEIIVLKNGLRIVTEQIPYVKSVAVGLWVGTGSCRETRANSGISHFIEHMLFKGTETRTAKALAGAIDDIGGQINAFTGRDCTCYYAKVLCDHLDIAVDVLSDMLFRSLFDEKDMALEKSVIHEEITMYEDTPEELVHDLLMEKAWRGNALGYSVLGTARSLKGIDKKAVADYMDANYTPRNSVLSVAGNFEKAALLAMLEEKFGGWEDKGGVVKSPSAPRFTPSRTEVHKEIEQTHLCVGYDAPARGHELSYAMMVVNTVLGSGMSSRLFQKIREDKGLVYSVYSCQSIFAKAGLFTIYAGMNPARLDEVTRLIFSEVDALKQHGIDETELRKCKEQLKGNLILGLERTSGRMHSFGQSLLLTDKIRTLDEMIKKIDGVNTEAINRAIALVFQNPAVAIVQNKPV